MDLLQTELDNMDHRIPSVTGKRKFFVAPATASRKEVTPKVTVAPIKLRIHPSNKKRIKAVYVKQG